MIRSGRSLRWSLPILALALVPRGGTADPGPGVRVDRVPGAPVERASSTARSPLGLRPAADTLTLSRAIETALERHPAISAGRAAVSAEAAARWADWGSFLPRARALADFQRVDATRITFEGEEGTSKESPTPISFVRKAANQALAFDWTLLDGGRRFFRLAEGRARKAAAEHRLDGRERAVAARVKRAYYETLKQQRLVEAGERQLEARQEELELTKNRYDAGSAGRIDWLGARMKAREAEVRLLARRHRAADQLRRLRTEMGLRRGEPPRLEAVADVAVPRASGLDSVELVERALSSDPEALALRAEERAAGAVESQAWTRYLPEISLSYTELRSEVGGGGTPFLNFDPRDEFSHVALEVSWDLFTGFDRREEKARADAAYQEARARRETRALELERRVRSRVEGIRRRGERLGALEQNYELARERLDLARMRYEAGRMAFDRFQTFVEDLTAAQEAFLDERYEYLKAWSELEQMVGDLARPPAR